VGRTLQVLWEGQANGRWNGLTGNYIRVETNSEADLHNRITPVQLTRMTGDGLLGELSANTSPNS
jgi:hypothetical protein